MSAKPAKPAILISSLLILLIRYHIRIVCYPDIRLIYHIGYDIRIGKSDFDGSITLSEPRRRGSPASDAK